MKVDVIRGRLWVSLIPELNMCPHSIDIMCQLAVPLV